MLKHISRLSLKPVQMYAGLVLFIGHSTLAPIYAQPPLETVEYVELDRYLGVWYEIARKPMVFQSKCNYDVTTTYTINENGNVHILNRCFDKQAKKTETVAEGFVANAPFNSQLKVSALPEIVRWIPIARGDYWILKIDEQYQTVLVGEPSRRYLWVLSRQPNVDTALLQQYLEYAKSQGYDVTDLVYTSQTHTQAKTIQK